MLYAQGWPGTCIQSTQCQTYVMHGVKCTHSAKRNHARCQMYTQCQTYVMHGVKCKHSAKRFSCTVPNVHTVSNVCHANVHTVPNVRHTRCQMYTQCQTYVMQMCTQCQMYVIHGVKCTHSVKRMSCTVSNVHTVPNAPQSFKLFTTGILKRHLIKTSAATQEAHHMHRQIVRECVEVHLFLS